MMIEQSSQEEFSNDSARSGPVDEITNMIDNSSNLLSPSNKNKEGLEIYDLGKGTNFLYNGKNKVPKTVESVVIEPHVRHIKPGAFMDRRHLKNVDFSNAKLLEDIHIRAFQGCKSLQCLHFPHTLVNIGAQAFRGCEKLQKVDFPKGTRLSTIGADAFGGCSQLKFMNMSNATSLAIIQYCAFQRCSSLQKIAFPPSIKWIGWKAFYKCGGLEKIDFRNVTMLQEIAPRAFQHCKSLRELVLPANLQQIGEFAFAGCSNLEQATFPSALRSFQSDFLQDCINLKSIEMSGESFCLALQLRLMFPKIHNISFERLVALSSKNSEIHTEFELQQLEKAKLVYLESNINSLSSEVDCMVNNCDWVHFLANNVESGLFGEVYSWLRQNDAR